MRLGIFSFVIFVSSTFPKEAASAAGAFVVPPAIERGLDRGTCRQSSTIRHAAVAGSSQSPSEYATGDDRDGFDDNPDLVGVRVDGFPLPPLPVREDDDELLAAIRRVPVTSIYDGPLSRGRVGRHNNICDDASSTSPPSGRTPRPLRVIVAGGGLGGLAVASALIRRGFDVHVFEQARRYRPFGGPIQIQSNALWALREINPALYSAVEECSVRTGDRLSGIKDGVRYREGWLVKFDAATPALRKDLPLTVAINRVVLQDIFLKYGVPAERVHTSSRVVSYENLRDDDGRRCGVGVRLDDGRTAYGDVLIGADGIWSRVRHQMYGLPPDEVGPAHATRHARYSGYACFTGTCRHSPADVAEVAYKVFLGQRQYLGCTDAGHGWQHWWAFLPDPPGVVCSATESSSEEPMLDRLRREFAGWSPEVMDLFDATDPDVVRRRDLFDRPPLLGGPGWVDGSVALLGDAAHPTMPNLGQGGAMAIEDAYVLGEELGDIRHTDEVPSRLKSYEKRRFLRASIAQFLSRNGSDLLVDWEKLRTTPVIGPIAMWMVNVIQPITMDYLYSADI